MIAIDGREAKSVGVTTSDEAGLMLDLGVYNGVNLDGGGSTALVQSDNKGGAVLIDTPSGTDGAVERYVGNNLGIYVDPLPTPEPASMLELAIGFIGLFGTRYVLMALKRRSFERGNKSLEK